MSRLRILAAAAGLALVAGCGGGGSSNSVVNAQPNVRNVDETANGTTLHVHFGDTIIVTLHSTYWNFLPTEGYILQPLGPVATSTPSATACPHIPGSGCGEVTQTYNVGKVGTAVLKAHRDSCGEALRCVGKQADWTVTVVAT